MEWCLECSFGRFTLGFLVCVLNYYLFGRVTFWFLIGVCPELFPTDLYDFLTVEKLNQS